MGQHCKVLLVDDSADIARLIENYSSGEPIELLVAATAEEGLEKLKQTRFDLILMDFHLPGMDGAAAVRCARILESQLKRRPSPIFALTDLLDLDSSEKMLTAGCTALMGKPLSRQHFLPIASRWRPRTPEIVPVKETSLKPLNILIAEDSADSRVLLEIFLRGGMHRWKFADNGQVAVDLFTVENFDLILMDIRMPVMDGFAATCAIRAIEQQRGSVPVPIVALTGNKTPDDVASSSAAGFDRHLSKPISKRLLLDTIDGYGLMMSLEAVSPPVTENAALHGYLSAQREELPVMRALLAASDFAQLVVLAHNIKHSGRSFGSAPLTRLGDVLERSARQADGPALDRQLTKISDYLDQFQSSSVPAS